ncbi:hypothetical protein CU311_02450 [Prochlorococcus marinus str. MU1402]|uniref:hypothetical protein n=1 Tax=Prochlorococcus marinus TaxID=1219 RepID=UPI001ADB2A83|nr:hypothetical protein [Prochlorococcus marinus]MBO8231506.1 hypothetical protein [Prochlorococcus marinus XMU1402]MBW3056265.1 hypothetical protein [Prochlorococcus marinus str. MU1402]
MLLKNHLIEVFKKASSENNFLLKENVVLKWVHRFGIDSLDDLLIHSPVEKENHEEKNQEQIRIESFKTLEKLEEINCESNYLKISNNNEVLTTKQYSNQKNQYIENPKLPLPNIKNLRKWINKDKKAS